MAVFISDYILLMNNDPAITQLKCCIAEILGTAILVYIGCMSCAFQIFPPPILMETIGFIFGIAVLMSVQVCFAYQNHVMLTHISIQSCGNTLTHSKKNHNF